MRFKTFSFRAQFVFMIVLMGSVGIIGPIYIIDINHEKNIEYTRLATIELVNQEIISLTKKHNELLHEYGLRLQQSTLFRKGIKQHDFKLVKQLLNEEIEQYHRLKDELVISKMFAFDTDYNNISESTVGEEEAYRSRYQICSQLPFEAKKRTGASRLKRISSFCYHEEHAQNSVIVPIGGLVPIGYLQIVSRPHSIFKQAEKKTGMAIQIFTSENKVSYQSTKWLPENKNTLTVTHHIYDIRHNPAVSIVMQKDITKLNQSFKKSKMLIISIISVVTFIVVSLFYLLFDTSLITPLNRLGKQLTLLEKDENLLGQQLILEGGEEIQSITKRFNALSNKLSKSYDKLENLAYVDQLTLLPNRERLRDILQVYARLSQYNGTPFCLMIIDLDRFKTINDTLGHHAGDLLLVQVSERLKQVLLDDKTWQFCSVESQLNERGFVSRLGADEFAVVLPLVGDTDTAVLIAKKILRVIRDNFEVDQFKFNLSASIGIVISPDHGDTVPLIMQHADIAMHHAKESKLGMVVYSNTLHEPRMHMLNIDNELRKALEKNELHLVFQPKIDMRTQRISSVEVLLRWTHAELGFISPDVFITIAEQTGLINDVTRWVIHEAFTQKQAWDKQNINLTVSINLSAINLWDKGLLALMRAELVEHNIIPQSIILELTETAVMSDPEYAITKLKQLSDLGLKISIDDFGTGYSSLNYLKKLPVDEIKIDRSFVMDMITDENDSIIVQSTIDLAHNMGLKVVAEGVETQEAFDQLKLHSCDLAQGYLMAKPMSNDDFIEWLKTSPWGLS